MKMIFKKLGTFCCISSSNYLNVFNILYNLAETLEINAFDFHALRNLSEGLIRFSLIESTPKLFANYCRNLGNRTEMQKE